MKRAPSSAPELPGLHVVRTLGSGGFSDVFLYQQDLPRREVAVKVLLGTAATVAERRQFTDEANLMARLSTHPSIVTIYHADVAADGRPYLVMEYCSGPNLSVRYKSQPLPVDEVLRIGVKIACAVATAHAAGILHRDIKPANILTNDFGGPALTDFGISSVEEDAVGQTTTIAALAAAAGSTAGGGSTVGLSVPWSPPEMFAEDPQADVRADVFSLGATLYTLLAGRTPFERPGSSNTQLDLAARIQRGDVTPLGREDVPVALLAVLEKAMSPRREGRYARAVDLARALQAVEIGLGYHATPLELPLLREDRVETVDDPDAGETRVAAVRDVVAQPPVRPPAARPSSAPPPATPATEPQTSPPVRTKTAPTVKHHVSVPVDSTVVRGAPVESTVIRPSAPPAGAEPETFPRPRRRVSVRVIVVLAIAAALGITAIVLGVVFAPPPGSTPEETPVAESGDPLGMAPPVPTDLVVTAVPAASGSGFDLQASWVAEGAEATDRFKIEVLRGADVIFTDVVDSTSTVVPDQSQNTGVCIAVTAVRNGVTSADVAQECL